ncbi:hypothetical protein SAMN05192574_10399 [Mucilaginibacter gossypiicola]|uniref:Uncharacterized protein n=2 Tax=Mucilaginibacter gossypiicola TaxID=551995 RepID=A0A1H8GEJ1_9SPHI|nr:hypothetical protein SAMN05192574_10399 [Mucilaginibacter gossypiicola]
MGYLFLFLVLRCKLLNHLFKKLNMKNFKLGFLALAIAVSFAACKGSSSASSADSTKADTSKMAADTTKADSAKADTTKAAAADTTKKDTTKK